MGKTPDAERTPIYGLGVGDIIAIIGTLSPCAGVGESPLMRVALGWAGCGTKSHVGHYTSVRIVQ